MQDIIHFVTVHWLLFLALLAVLVALVKVEWDEGAAGLGPAMLSSQQAVTLINHEQAVVVDLRGEEDYAKGHVLAAISLPLAQLDKQMALLKKYPANPLILYGVSAKDFEATQSTLTSKGRENVFYLVGGLSAWQAAGMPVEHAEGGAHG